MDYILLVRLKEKFQLKIKKKNKIKDLLDKIRNTEIYKDILKKFPDAELINVELEKKKDDK